MLLTCCIEVNNRFVQVHNSKACSTKSSRGAIGLYKKCRTSENSQKMNENIFHIVLYTSRYKSGFKYRVKENILKVFSRFMETGRTTISFKEPQHDLSISEANPSDLKKFLHGIKLACRGEDLGELQIARSTAVQDVFEACKKEMKVKSRKDYPLSKPFPVSLCKLSTNNCGLVKFDSRIRKLTMLTVLNLSENRLSELPESLEELSWLKELYLAKNKFLTIPTAIFRPKIRSSLRLLDMSWNQLQEIPSQISLLQKLTNLKLDSNEITTLPYNIEMLKSLKYISIARNKLKVLPYGICTLSIDSLDLSGNPLDINTVYCITANKLKSIPTLFELSARQIKNSSLGFLHEDLPLTISYYLNAARTCFCGRYCFESYAVYITMIDLGRIAHTVTADILNAGKMSAPVEGYICSNKCYNRWQKKPNAIWY